MTNTQTLASEACDLMNSMRWDDRDGHEVAPGFLNIYNRTTGQSKTVLLHPESGLIFKEVYDAAEVDTSNSNRFIAHVLLNAVSFPIRLPYFEVFQFGDRYICAQEYVQGEFCACGGGSCENSWAIRSASRCQDAHCGNYKIVNGEIVLFDFEGIRA